MRGPDQMLETYKRNKIYMGMLGKALAIYFGVLTLLYYLSKKSMFVLAVLCSLDAVFIALLYRLCKPTIVMKDKNEHLESIVGVDSKGMPSFYLDAIFWSMLAKIVSLKSKYFVLIYLAIPVSFFYEIMYKPYKSLKDRS
ncbi:hypothetical protein ENBRE01_0543 [Enteropsectra breve]|nr:hypothetical protein ENBRE01_0543 [Enteropsectra breve]